MRELNFSNLSIILTLTLIFIILFSSSSYSLDLVADLYNAGDYQEAISHLEQINVNDYQDLSELEKYRHLALLHKEAGNRKRYREILFDLHTEHPENKLLHLDTAVAFYQNADYQEAAVLFDELLINLEDKQFEDNEGLPVTELMRLYYYQGKNARARENFTKARYSWRQGLEVEEHSQFYIELGNLKFDLNEYQKAYNYYQLALDLDSSLNYLYPKMAEAAENFDDLSKAADYWQQSLETGIHPERAEKNLTRLRQIMSEPEDIAETEEEELPEVDIEEVWQPEWHDIARIDDHENSPQIKIKTGTPREELLLKFDSSFVIETRDGNTVASGNAHEVWEVSLQENSLNLKSQEHEGDITSLPAETELIFQSSNNNSSYMLHNVMFGADYYWAGREDRQYRGDLLIYPQPEQNNFITVNQVHLEEYLLSVVPSEMPASWPEEALKAQVLAARSYAYHNLGRRHEDDPYNLCDTVHCAVYSGVKSETERTNSAVKKTIGEVGLYEGEVIEAVFSSNSGGHTEAASNVWGGETEYLSGADLQKNTDYDFPLLPFDLRNWLTRRVQTYSGPGGYSYEPAYRWIRRLDSEFLQENFDLDKIIDVTVEKRTDKGYVQSLIIMGEDDLVEISGDSIRSALGGLRSNKFIIQNKYTDDGEIQSVSFYGAGWGHGVGMDQTASAQMAQEGMNYKDIFSHFYQNIKIDTIY